MNKQKAGGKFYVRKLTRGKGEKKGWEPLIVSVSDFGYWVSLAGPGKCHLGQIFLRHVCDAMGPKPESFTSCRGGCLHGWGSNTQPFSCEADAVLLNYRYLRVSTTKLIHSRPLALIKAKCFACFFSRPTAVWQIRKIVFKNFGCHGTHVDNGCSPVVPTSQPGSLSRGAASCH